MINNEELLKKVKQLLEENGYEHVRHLELNVKYSFPTTIDIKIGSDLL